uniref:gluconokinase n=1 Tax=Strigops habroptila TaxID=2489341 RepID=A0A672UCA8_STRHB
ARQRLLFLLEGVCCRGCKLSTALGSTGKEAPGWAEKLQAERAGGARKAGEPQHKERQRDTSPRAQACSRLAETGSRTCQSHAEQRRRGRRRCPGTGLPAAAAFRGSGAGRPNEGRGGRARHGAGGGDGRERRGEDRIPWLWALHDILRREHSSRQDAVLACSALKKMYRHVLVSGASAIESNHPEQPKENPALQILFVHLDGPADVIAGRLEKRRGHFMPPELLKSQFDTLEPPCTPENFITVSLEKSLPEMVLEIEHAIFSG